MESRKSVNIIKHIFTRGNPFSFEFDTVTRTGSLANCFFAKYQQKVAQSFNFSRHLSFC